MANSNVKSEVIVPAEDGLPKPAPIMSLRLAGEPAKDTTEIDTPDNRAPAAKADTNPAPEDPKRKNERLRRKVQALFRSPDVEDKEGEEEGDEDKKDEGDQPSEPESFLTEDKSTPPSGAHRVYRENAQAILRDGLTLSLETYAAGDSDSAFALFVAAAEHATALLNEGAEACKGETASAFPTTQDLLASAIAEAFGAAAEHAATDEASFFIGDEAAEERKALEAKHEGDFALADAIAKLRKGK